MSNVKTLYYCIMSYFGNNFINIFSLIETKSLTDILLSVILLSSRSRLLLVIKTGASPLEGEGSLCQSRDASGREIDPIKEIGNLLYAECPSSTARMGSSNGASEGGEDGRSLRKYRH